MSVQVTRSGDTKAAGGITTTLRWNRAHEIADDLSLKQFGIIKQVGYEQSKCRIGDQVHQDDTQDE